MNLFIICSKSIKHMSLLLVFMLFPATSIYAGDGGLVWAKSMTGTFYTEGFGITADSSGNVYTTGSFNGTADFDPGPNVFNLTSQGGANIFVSKLDRNSNFVWAKAMAVGSPSRGYGIAFDGSGNVYITGRFQGTVDFDPGSGIYNVTSVGNSMDIFISKLNSNGEFVWVKTMGGDSGDEGYGIAVDTTGNVYTTGFFSLTVDFDPGQPIYNLTSKGGWDAFMSKLDTNGNFIWAEQGGAGYSDQGNDIAVDTSGNIYTAGKITPHISIGPCGLVTKQDSSGTSIWVKFMCGNGGTGWAEAYSVAVDTSGNVYTTGAFRETVDFDPGGGVTNLTSLGPLDIFISKIDSDGDYVWARNMGGTSSDYGYGIAVDNLGFVYIAGIFGDTIYFASESKISNLTSAGKGDILVSKLDSSGSFVWAKAFGDTDDDLAWDIAIGELSSVHTTGWFIGTVDFDPGPGTVNLVSNVNNTDAFILKLHGTESFFWPMFFPSIINNTPSK